MMVMKVRRSNPSFPRHGSNSSPHRFSGPKVPTQDKGKGKAIEDTEVAGNKGVLLILSFLARHHEANQGYRQRSRNSSLAMAKAWRMKPSPTRVC